MAKLEYMETNLIKILLEVMKNKDIMDLLVGQEPDDGNTVEDQFPDAPINHILFTYPMNPNVTNTVTCTLRIYYPNLKFMHAEEVQSVRVIFDVVCHNSLWMDNGMIRPYRIMRHLVNTFDDKTISSIGDLGFIGSENHIHVNEDYQCLRLQANMFLFS